MAVFTRNRIGELADESRLQLINTLTQLTNNFVAYRRELSNATRTLVEERCKPTDVLRGNRTEILKGSRLFKS